MSWQFIRFTSALVSAFSRTVGHLELSNEFLTFSKLVLIRKLNQMFAFIVQYTHHMSIYWVSMFIIVIWLASGTLGSLGNTH